MYNPSRLSVCLLVSIVLVSCATPGLQVEEQPAGNYKYDAWRLDSSGDYEAINVLLDEADRLIDKNELNAAADKLERVLRIKPEYAPAWSRLSWVALQADSPNRSVQMAKRSNSFAYSDPELQLLNWSFIRTASQMLNDDETYRQADQKINLLKSF
ncbi:MAG: hypothetical protein ACC650_05595 [Gammaproteobacteria bacterium]